MNDNSYTPVIHEVFTESGENNKPNELEIQPTPERTRLSKEEKDFAARTANDLLRHITRQPMSAATRKAILKHLSAEYTKSLGFNGRCNDSVIAEKLTQICPDLAITARHDKSGELWAYTDNKWSHISGDKGESIVTRALHHALPDGINNKKANSVFKTLRSMATTKPNRRPGLIPYANGVYDIRTGELHQHHPDFGIEGLIPCDYTSEYTPPEQFIQFVKAASNDNPERHKLMLAQFKYHIENRYRDQIFF